MTWFYIYCLLLFTMLLDGAWIGLVASKLYRKELGDMVRERPKGLPGLLFYLLYPLAVTVYVVWPNQGAANLHDFTEIILYGVGFGLAAYGTYALTCWTIFKRFSAKVALPDILWGAFLTGLMGLIGSTVWLAAR